MKKSEIAMIVLIASVSMMAAFAIANSVPFLKVDKAGVKVDQAVELSADVSEPDTRVFNKDAINPTVKTVIGE